MNIRLGTSVLVAAMVLAGCGGTDDADTADVGVQDTLGSGMPSGGMPGGMGPMAGMGSGMMSSEWRQHMAMMHSATGDSLQAMMPMHRQMVTRMMETMEGGMGMARDSAWMATRDSLHRDMDRMQNMNPAEMEAFLEEHDARMQRMLRMHQAAPGAAPSAP